MLRTLWSDVELNCYDGEEDAAAAEAAAAAAGAKSAEAAKADAGLLTKAQVDAYLAEDRRKTESKHKVELKTALQKQETTLNNMLASKSLTEQERDSYREQLADVEKQLHTKEELLRKEKKQVEDSLTAKLKAAEQERDGWLTRFRDSNVQRELQDHAVKNDAFNARQLMLFLKPSTKLEAIEGGEYQVVVTLEDEVDGKPVTKSLPVADAIKRMKELPHIYGGFFKANVAGGLGATAGDKKVSDGKFDAKTSSMEEYMKVRKENRSAIFGK